MRIIAAGNGEPATVGAELVEAIRAREKDGLVQLPAPPRLRRGDRVRVNSGFLVGALGLFAGQRGAARCAVLLDLLGRRVVLASGCVEAAAPPVARSSVRDRARTKGTR